MKIFSRIAAAALAALAVTGTPALAMRPGIERQNPSSGEVERLMATAERVGVTFFTEDDGVNAAEACEKNVFGMANTDLQVLLCVDNHDGDWVELTDTLRHELVHIAQFCNGGLQEARMLRPDLYQDYLDYADDYLGWGIQQNYPQAAWGFEGEAFSLAFALTGSQIEDLLIEYCG